MNSLKMRIRTVFTDETYRGLIRLMIPIVVQNLFSAMVSSADVIMLNSVGQTSLAAVSLAVQYSNIISMVFYGIGTGVTILCSQYWGKQDLNSINRIAGIALRFGIGAGLILSAAGMSIPRQMMHLFTSDQTLIDTGASYLRIVALSYLFWGISETFLALLRSIERVRISMVLNVTTLILNIILNAVFIYGLFGAPKLGARGVAIATTISRGLQMVACMFVSAVSRDVKLQFRRMFEPGGPLLKDFLKVALPATANDIIWSTAFSMYLVIMGHISSDLVAANSIISVVRNFGTILCFAIASAAGIYVGKTIGTGDLEKAREDGRKSVVLTIASAVIGGLLVALASPFLIRFAQVSDVAKGYLKVMMLIHTYYIMGIAINTTLIVGLFRAGGDSRFGMICDTIDMWCYAVPLGFLAAFVLKLPPMVVYFLLCTDEFVKWPWVIRHYRSGRWIRNITR